MKKLLLIGVIASIWSCTGEKSSSVPSYQISFIDQLSLNFGEVGMSSEIPFSISPLDTKNLSFLVFNTFYRRLDTVSFSPDKKRIVPGLEVPKEGPSGIPGLNKFTYTENGIIFFTLNEFYYFKDGETVKMKMTEVIDDGIGSIKSIVEAGGSGVFQPAPFNGDYLSLIIKDSEEEKFTLMKYDFESFTEIPFEFDYVKLARNRISFEIAKGTIVSNSYNPSLTLSDSVLIISYPFMNKISTVRLDDLTQTDFFPESQLFKSQKDKPIESSEIKSFEEYYEASTNWHKDVNFGAIQILNSQLFYRLVGTGEMNPPKLVLELFNNEFEKVGEFDLKSFQNDLKWFHITVDGKILIQSWKDPDEDIFKYYLISVDSV